MAQTMSLAILTFLALVIAFFLMPAAFVHSYRENKPIAYIVAGVELGLAIMWLRRKSSGCLKLPAAFFPLLHAPGFATGSRCSTGTARTCSTNYDHRPIPWT
jgi:hypothetical protein